MKANARLHNPSPAFHGVIQVPPEFGGVFLLSDCHGQGVGGREVRLQPHDLKAVLNVVFTQDVFEVKSKIEALHLTEPSWRTHLVKIDSVIAQGEVPVEQHRTPWRHHGEGAAPTNIAPTVIRKIHACAVVQHTGIVVEVEAKQTQLRTVSTAEGEFAVSVCETKGQAAVADVGVKQRRRLLQVTVLYAQQIANSPRLIL